MKNENKNGPIPNLIGEQTRERLVELYCKQCSACAIERDRAKRLRLMLNRDATRYEIMRLDNEAQRAKMRARAKARESENAREGEEIAQSQAPSDTPPKAKRGAREWRLFNPRLASDCDYGYAPFDPVQAELGVKNRALRQGLPFDEIASALLFHWCRPEYQKLPLKVHLSRAIAAAEYETRRADYRERTTAERKLDPSGTRWVPRITPTVLMDIEHVWRG